MPQRVLFVEELSELLTEGLPDLWKLGQVYFSGALIGDVSYMSTVYILIIIFIFVSMCTCAAYSSHSMELKVQQPFLTEIQN